MVVCFFGVPFDGWMVLKDGLYYRAPLILLHLSQLAIPFVRTFFIYPVHDFVLLTDYCVAQTQCLYLSLTVHAITRVETALGDT